MPARMESVSQKRHLSSGNGSARVGVPDFSATNIKASVDTMLSIFEWRTVENKLSNDIVAINETDRLVPPKRKIRNTHSRFYQTVSTSLDYRKWSFSRVPSENGMPYHWTLQKLKHLRPFKGQVSKIKY